MEIKIWWLWMLLAAIFIIGEIFTAGFFVLWFGIGAAAAGIMALLGLGAGWQLEIFVVVSGVLIAIKYLEALQKIADGQATKVFLPYEASGILGSIAGISELLKEKIPSAIGEKE